MPAAEEFPSKFQVLSYQASMGDCRPVFTSVTPRLRGMCAILQRTMARWTIYRAVRFHHRAPHARAWTSCERPFTPRARASIDVDTDTRQHTGSKGLIFRPASCTRFMGRVIPRLDIPSEDAFYGLQKAPPSVGVCRVGAAPRWGVSPCCHSLPSRACAPATLAPSQLFTPCAPA